MTPPDETLVAIVATTVSFLVVVPFLIKWWPRVQAKADEKRRRTGPGARSAKPATSASANPDSAGTARTAVAAERRSGAPNDPAARRPPEIARPARSDRESGARARSPRTIKKA